MAFQWFDSYKLFRLFPPTAEVSVCSRGPLVGASENNHNAGGTLQPSCIAHWGEEFSSVGRQCRAFTELPFTGPRFLLSRIQPPV